MRITFNHGKAGKYDGDDNMVMAATKNCYGYNWWLWTPFIRLRFKRYGIYFDSSWLCYWWGFFLNYKTPKEEPGGQLSPNQVGE